MQEVSDVAPPNLVLVCERQGVSEHRLELLLEDLTELLGRELAFHPPPRVDRVLVAVERHLAKHCGEGVFDLAAQQRQLHRRIFLLGHDSVEGQRLAEHGCSLGERQRRVVVEYVLPRRKAVMQPVTQLVRQHECVAQLPGEVQHHVRVVVWRDAHAVSAAGLARYDWSIDPALLEEVFDQRPGLLGEPVVGAEHQLFRGFPRKVARRVADRRVPIPLVQLADVEQLALDAVIANADVVASGDRVDKRLYRLVRSLVGQVAGADPRREMTETIVDRLFLEDHVEDVAAGADVAAKGLRHRAAGFATDVAIGLAQERERLVEREVAPIDVDANARAQLLEQPDP